MIRFYFFLSCLFILVSCLNNNPNLNKEGIDKIETHLKFVDQSIQNYQDTVYVPVYSDIYSEVRTKSILLTATLSIRSTSLTDTTYINRIDYYNTAGEMVKSYLNKTLILAPLESIDYVIEREDNTGGTGANFMVMWGAKKNTNPLFQCVMVATYGQHGFAFSTNGISLKN